MTTSPLRRTAGGIPRFKPEPQPAKPGLILTASQAEAVYSAMCALNNVSGKIAVMFSGVMVIEGDQGLSVSTPHGNDETYASQSELATAYGLQQG